MAAAGIRTDAELVADGTLRRFHVQDDKRGTKNGWYILFADGIPAGEFGTWKGGGQSHTWRADIGRTLTSTEHAELRARAEESKRAREAELKKVRKNCRDQCKRMWDRARAADAAHPYLMAKAVQAHGLRQLKDMLLVPVKDVGGLLHGLQFIKADGHKTFKTGTQKTGAFHLVGIPDGELFAVAEGYATAATVHELTGWPVAVAFDAGNLEPVARALRDAHPRADLILCADNDHETAGNPGLTKARAAANAVHGGVAVPAFESGEAGTDWNDYASIHGGPAARQALLRVTDTERVRDPVRAPDVVRETHPETHDPLTPHYEARDDGVYWCGVSYSNGEPKPETPLFICSPLKILAASRDTNASEWGRLLEFRDLDGNLKRWAMPVRLLGGSRGDEIRAELMAAGLPYIVNRPKERFRLIDYLMTQHGTKRVRSVTRTGWHGDVFVLPSQSFGETEAESFYFQSESMDSSVYQSTGDLERWVERVAKPAGAHRRLVLALSTAFAGPLIALAGGESGGFHLVGGSSSGKTTALRLASSVWGNPSTYWRQWRTTDNGLEAVAEDFTDCLMALDEIGQADAKDIGAMAYMLANGRGKQRAGKSGGARAVKTWRVMLLSTGEVGTATMLNAAGQKQRGGHDVRLVEVTADSGEGFGIFDSTGDCETPRELAAKLMDSAGGAYGLAGPAFVEKVAADKASTVANVQRTVERFVKLRAPANANGQVYRVAARFGLLVAAGQLATQFGLTGWDIDQVEASINDAFAQWLERRGTAGAQEPAAMVNQVRHFLELHGGARFQDLRPQHEESEQKVINRAGFRKIHDMRPVYMIMPEVFRNEVCAGYQHTDVAKALDAAGCLVKQGGSDKRYTLKARCEAFDIGSGGSGKTMPFYVIDRDRLFSTDT